MKDAKKVNIAEFSQIAFSFYMASQKHKQDTDTFNETKQKFYEFADEYFKANEIDGKLWLDDSLLEHFAESVSCMTIQRIQKSSVKFDVDKLEKVLDKSIKNKVINKTYEITDISGLIAYLKELGADPKIFKSFLNIIKSVNIKELENLEKLGDVSMKQLKGTYTVNTSNPYFTFKVEE